MNPLIPYFDMTNLSVVGVGVQVPGVALMLGMAASIWLMLRRCRQAQLDTALVFQALPSLIIGAVVGGHLFHVLLADQTRFRFDPTIIFRVWDGQSIMGGALLGAVVGLGYLRMKLSAVVGVTPHSVRQELWRYSDAIAFALPLGGMIARLGCFSVHDHPGVETSFWLGVYGICPLHNPDIACHDLGLYEAFVLGVIFLIFMALDKVPRFHGYYLLWLCILYGFSRFILDWLRHPDIEIRYGLLTSSQIISIGLMVFGIRALSRHKRVKP